MRNPFNHGLNSWIGSDISKNADLVIRRQRAAQGFQQRRMCQKTIANYPDMPVSKAVQYFQTTDATVQARLQEKVFIAPSLTDRKTAGQHATTGTGKRFGRGCTFTRGGSDRKGGKSFTTDTDASI